MVSFVIHPPEILPEFGLAYQVSVDPSLPADSMDFPSRSRLFLFEDGVLLGPCHSFHQDIRERGGGRYSHWQTRLIFSSTDGSDPRRSGKTYSCVFLKDDESLAFIHSKIVQYLRTMQDFPSFKAAGQSGLDEIGIVRALGLMISLPARRALLDGGTTTCRWFGTVTADQPCVSPMVGGQPAGLGIVRLRNTSGRDARVTGFCSNGQSMPWSKTALLDAIRGEAESDRELAFSLWQYMARNGSRGTSAVSESWRRDPSLFLWVFGGDCGDFAMVYTTLARALGLQARAVFFDGHAVPEAWFDGRWNMLDPNLVFFSKSPDGGHIENSDDLTEAGLLDSHYGYPVAANEDRLTKKYAHVREGYNRVFRTRTFTIEEPKPPRWVEPEIRLSPGDEIAFLSAPSDNVLPFFTDGTSLISPPLWSYRLTHHIALDGCAPPVLEKFVGLPILDAVLRVELPAEPMDWPDGFDIEIFSSGRKIGALTIDGRHFTGRNEFYAKMGEALSVGMAKDPITNIAVILPSFLAGRALSAEIVLIGQIVVSALPDLIFGRSDIRVLGEYERLEVGLGGDFTETPDSSFTVSPPATPSYQLAAGKDGEEDFVILSWEGDSRAKYEVMVCRDAKFIEPIFPQYMTVAHGVSMRIPASRLSGIEALYWRVREVMGKRSFGPPACGVLTVPIAVQSLGHLGSLRLL